MRKLILFLCLVAGIASAAVDTRDKRASASNVGMVDIVLPNPDGVISAADRAQVAGEYSGLAVGEPPEFSEKEKVLDLLLGPWISID